jgi:hypothetical protein
MKKYVGVLAIVMLIGLFLGNTANAQHRGPHHRPHRGHYHHPPRRAYHHHRGGATVKIHVPAPPRPPRRPRVIVRP